MTDGIDPVAHGMQATNRKAVIHGVLPQPQPQQLPPRNNPMLSLRQFRHKHVRTTAKPSQPAYIAG